MLTIVQVFIVLLLLGRIMQSFKERLSIQGDKEPTSNSSALATVKCYTLKKSHPRLKEDENSEVADDLNVSKPTRRNIICIMVRYRTKGKPQCSDQEQPMSETGERIQTLDQELKAIETQVQEAKTFFKHLPATDKQLRLSIVMSMACVRGQALSLQEVLLRIKEMAASLGGKDRGENLELGVTGNGDHVDDLAKESRKKLRCAATSCVCLHVQDI